MEADKQKLVENEPSPRLRKAIKMGNTGRGKILKTEENIRRYVRTYCSKSK